jgi:hypothetical protein
VSERYANEKRAAALETLAAVSERFPALRICQLVMNATAVSDPYYLTDHELNNALMAYLERHGTPPRKREGK